ncbi:glycosyltransferase [Methylobacterium oryzae]|uniref:glycosyltransferase n=1 Tax=Methylobacterium oryzae TaxID=334852 RepID=UPI001F39BA0D|nr:glycosyltransferase family 4 protein [Methylobacterium oryzae]UIN32912.1 glycosyltransferase [Methylobacterium oryzae]
MAKLFRKTFSIPSPTLIHLKTWSGAFSIDEWCPDEVVNFVEWYFRTHPNTCAIIVNYVFLSRSLEVVPEGVTRVIDTHDRFADRNRQYWPFKSEPNFFYTSRQCEAVGLSRADIVLAIQSEEADYFRSISDRHVVLLPPRFPEARQFQDCEQIRTIGFLGHGNDPNLFSISKFAHAWAEKWQNGFPQLIIAGEICKSLNGFESPGVHLLGYVEDIASFYDKVDVVVAPILMGSGLKMKVAEALAMGRPVIGTRIAFAGFDAVHSAHRLNGTSDAVAAVKELSHDSNKLRTLVEASSQLLSRYNVIAAKCETAFISLMPRVPSPSSSGTDSDLAQFRQEWYDLKYSTVIEADSLRARQSIGSGKDVLIATEKVSSEAALISGYRPNRRRWYAASPRRTSVRDRAVPSLDIAGGSSVNFSPEWVRDRILSRQAREEIIGYFSNVKSDWRSQARLVGIGGVQFTVLALAPSFLVGLQSPTSAFLVRATNSVREIRLSNVISTARPLPVDYKVERPDLRLIPVGLTFLTSTSDTAGDLYIPDEDRVLEVGGSSIMLLSDYLIGRLTIAN